MEPTSGARQPVVIGQDEGAELHVQVMTGSGRRQIDIRMWRKGPTGFAPSRSALTLDAAETDTVLHGISELLDASNGGQQVARVVWDKDEGRRLRAETEPFGTRFVARLGLWQRVRDSWKPVGDELVIAAEQLQPLRSVLQSMRPELAQPSRPEMSAESIASRLKGWPLPGADWITIEGDRLAFHPRGIRITAAVEEGGEEHWLVLQQWRREESLWLPVDGILTLHIRALDDLLASLRGLLVRGEEQGEGDEVTLADGTRVRPYIHNTGESAQLCIETAGEGQGGKPILAMPAAYLSRFGRMLADGASVLIAHLSHAERASLDTPSPPAPHPNGTESPSTPEGMREDHAPSGDPLPGTVAQPQGVRASMPVEPSALDSRVEGSILESDQAGEERHAAPAREEPLAPPRPLLLGQLAVGAKTILVYLHEDAGRYLALQWDGRELRAPMEHIGETLANLRTTYYDALRGRRGHVLTVPGDPQLVVGVHNLSSGAAMTLEHDRDGSITRLAIPLREVPDTLNTLEAAMKGQ